MNFFKQECQEPARNESLFGLCDDQEGNKAYTDLLNQTQWIATVKNNSNKNLVFTAIDKCVIQDDEVPDRARCDGMLISENNENLYFIELKDQRAKGWIPKAKKQLESTIQLFIEHHDVSVYKHKKAFACNKKGRPFYELDNEQKLRFRRKNGFILDVQASILVV